MKWFSGVVFASVVALFVTLTAAWFAFPQHTAPVLIKLNNAAAGLSAKTVQTRLGDIHYLEGGAGETVVLVHGIFARKEHWVDLARHLVANHHVIALDLPGFGDNDILEDSEYLLDQQQENLATVLDAIGVKRAHIAANSMGAYVSVLLAQKRPDLFASLAFIGSPLGVPTPLQSGMDAALSSGHIPLLVQSEADFYERNDWLSPELPYLPGPVLKTWMQGELAMADKNARIWDIVHNQSDVPTVLDIAPDLQMDTLIIWCLPDRIFHVSGADRLHAALGKAFMVTPDGCGHLPMLDKTDFVSAVFRDFLSHAEASGASN